MRIARLAALACLVFVSVAGAAPPWAEHIGADAAWMLHIDLERAARGAVGQVVIEAVEALDNFDLADPEDIDWMRGMTEGLQIEMGVDFHGFTAYGGDDPGGESTVVLWYGNAKLDRWEGYMVETMSSERADLEVDGEPVPALYTARFLEWDVPLRLGDDRRMWITTWDEAAAIQAVRVVRGAAAALKADSPLLQQAGRPGTIVLISATDLQHMEGFEPASEVAQRAESLWIALGEDESEAFLEATVTAGSNKDARAIAEVLQGLVALGRLTLGKDREIGPEVEEFLDAIHFRSDQTKVKMEVRQEVEKLQWLLDESEQ